MINTFVFMDLESTGLPMHGRVRATEVSLISVSRTNILNCLSNDFIPRIVNKISFVVNPRAMIPDVVVQMTGLSNETLEAEPPFDQNKADLIKLFLQCCVPPICLIAHNGFKFDFPLLKKELAAYDQVIPAGLLCADSMLGFKRINNNKGDAKLSPIMDQTDVMLFDEVSRIEESFNLGDANSSPIMDQMDVMLFNEVSRIEDSFSSQETNETTPVAQLITEPSHFSNGKEEATPPPLPSKTVSNVGSVKRKLFEDNERSGEQNSKLKLNYSLKHVYYSLFNQHMSQAHRAENDTIALLQCCVKIGQPLLQYFDSEAKNFEDIIPMR